MGELCPSIEARGVTVIKNLITHMYEVLADAVRTPACTVTTLVLPLKTDLCDSCIQLNSTNSGSATECHRWSYRSRSGSTGQV